MFIHEDNRRKLVEWAQGNFKVSKVLYAKEDCVVGDHHHLKKDETFLLVAGSGNFQVGGLFYLRVGSEVVHVIYVPRGTYHRFELKAGSILIGVATEEFDPTDEIPGKP